MWEIVIIYICHFLSSQKVQLQLAAWNSETKSYAPWWIGLGFSKEFPQMMK